MGSFPFSGSFVAESSKKAVWITALGERFWLARFVNIECLLLENHHLERPKVWLTWRLVSLGQIVAE